MISHSRGGLVGELLCRANVTGDRDPFDKSDLDFLRKNDPEKTRGDLAEFNKLLKAQSLHIERFVRVACPARGASLASERLDLYLSVLFNLIEKIPVLETVLDVFSELIMAIAKEREDPKILPGIEAMIPNSPLIRLLNRPGITVDGELRVVAGDIEGANLGAALSTLVTDPLYLGDHDLVVDTAAMFGGAERQPGAAKFSFPIKARKFPTFVTSSTRIAATDWREPSPGSPRKTTVSSRSTYSKPTAICRPTNATKDNRSRSFFSSPASWAAILPSAKTGSGSIPSISPSAGFPD